VGNLSNVKIVFNLSCCCGFFCSFSPMFIVAGLKEIDVIVAMLILKL